MLSVASSFECCWSSHCGGQELQRRKIGRLFVSLQSLLIIANNILGAALQNRISKKKWQEEEKEMSSMPYAMHMAAAENKRRLRNNEKHQHQKQQQRQQQQQKQQHDEKAHFFSSSSSSPYNTSFGVEVFGGVGAAEEYSSKMMNSIWGEYNRYSVHNFKSKQCDGQANNATTHIGSKSMVNGSVYYSNGFDNSNVGVGVNGDSSAVETSKDYIEIAKSVAHNLGEKLFKFY